MEPAATTGRPRRRARARARRAGSAIASTGIRGRPRGAIAASSSRAASARGLGRRRAHDEPPRRLAQQRLEHASDVLVAHRPEDQRDVRPARSPADRRQRARRRPGCVPRRAGRRVAASVECSSRPGQALRQSVANRLVRRPARRSRQLLQHRDRDGGVCRADGSLERQRDRPERAPPHMHVHGAVRTRDSARRRRRESCARPWPHTCRRRHGRPRRGSGPQTTGTPGLMMPAFSRAIDASVLPSCAW